MKKQRNNVFETNSSSTHTITVINEDVATPITPQQYFVELGEFGWEFNLYRTPISILSYLYTAICCNYGLDYKKYINIIENTLSRVADIKIEWEEPIFEEYDGKYYLENGYIDHGYELKKWLEDLFNSEKLLLATIFEGVIETGNDNDCDCVQSIISSNVEAYYSYRKGN